MLIFCAFSISTILPSFSEEQYQQNNNSQIVEDEVNNDDASMQDQLDQEPQSEEIIEGDKLTESVSAEDTLEK